MEPTENKTTIEEDYYTIFPNAVDQVVLTRVL